MSEHRADGRFDWLTGFFVVAAVALAGMWWLEQSQLETLESASVRAGELSRDHLGAGCEAFSAGQGGTTLVVRCLTPMELTAAKDAVRKEARAFEEVVFVKSDTDTIRCDLPDASECQPIEVQAFK